MPQSQNVPLTDVQIEYITTTTNSRGAAYVKNPYTFVSTALRPAPSTDYLAIYVALSSGGGHEASTNTHGQLHGTVDDVFMAMVTDVLDAIERHI